MCAVRKGNEHLFARAFVSLGFLVFTVGPEELFHFSSRFSFFSSIVCFSISLRRNAVEFSVNLSTSVYRNRNTQKSTERYSPTNNWSLYFTIFEFVQKFTISRETTIFCLNNFLSPSLFGIYYVNIFFIDRSEKL